MCYFMRTRINILTGLFLTVLFTSCKNSLIGIIYRDPKEVAQFKNYRNMGGSVIENYKDTSLNYEFGIAHFSDSVKNILTFERIIIESDNPQPKYKILDTINIDNIKENQYITFCKCRQDSIIDPQIIALVIPEDDKEIYTKILRAWRADTKTGKIKLIRNTKRINCINESYGLDGCGDEENIDFPSDSTKTR